MTGQKFKYYKKGGDVRKMRINLVRDFLFLALGSCLLVLIFSNSASAQNKKGSQAIIVAGRPLTEMDSVMVKDLFFKALREKTTENLTLAGELFDRVIHIDPANDAALYE